MKLTILVADDETLECDAFEFLAMQSGIECHCIKVKNGKEAVEKAREIRPQLIILDIQMPVMNGLEATREIRKLENPYAAGIPIIAMTADAFSENVAECFEAGMNGHIAKPIDINNVIRELRKINQAKPDFAKKEDYE